MTVLLETSRVRSGGTVGSSQELGELASVTAYRAVTSELRSPRNCRMPGMTLSRFLHAFPCLMTLSKHVTNQLHGKDISGISSISTPGSLNSLNKQQPNCQSKITKHYINLCKNIHKTALPLSNGEFSNPYSL